MISYQAKPISLCCGNSQDSRNILVRWKLQVRLFSAWEGFLLTHLTMFDHRILFSGTSSILLNLAPVVLGIVFFQFANLSLLRVGSWIRILPSMYMIYRCWIYPFYLSPLSKIPTVPCNPLWGHFFVLVREEASIPHRSWHQKYGNVVRFFLPFGIEVISVADEEALRQITVKDPYNFPYPSRAYILLRSILGQGLLIAQGESHALQRKTLAPGFSNASIKSLLPIFWRKGLLLTGIWQQEFVSRDIQFRSIDVFEWSGRVTLDIIGEAAFGVNIDSLRNPEAPLQRAYRLAFSTESNLFQLARGFFRFLKYIPMRVNDDVMLAQQIIKVEAAQIAHGILEKTSNAPDEKDIMSLIIKTDQSVTSPDSQMTLATLRDQVRTFLGAGHDTSSAAVAWSLLLLSQYPDIQTRLRQEIREHMPALFHPTRTDIASQEEPPDPDQLPYLDLVTRECLRFIPPIPLTVRQNRSPTHLASYPIPPGTFIYIPINAINHLPCYWGSDADTFDPERWNHLPPAWATSSYSTFLQGPKGCIARKFAETELKVLLCCLVSRYDFGTDETVENALDWKTWRVALRPRWGVTLKVGLIE